ncbi:unnamed protein product [Paramecium octaurelia]|uniref:Uncharacterized protein n=1 Tax=Paramecium octaurelia TaxID=43137 RepID=A0A8S1Y9B8_PAROT|nr:unnamed protein product [Paramecium octaurelia]
MLQDSKRHGPSLELQNLGPLHKSISKITDPDIQSFECQKNTYITSPRAQRFDKLGNLILKSQKKQYQITFRDEVTAKAKLYDIIIVDNWKNFNIIDEDKEKVGCCQSKSCQLF